MAVRATKRDLLYVIGECKKTIEMAQPGVRPVMHTSIKGDIKRALETAYFMLEASQELCGKQKGFAEAVINQVMGMMRVCDVDIGGEFDKRILGPAPSNKPS